MVKQRRPRKPPSSSRSSPPKRRRSAARPKKSRRQAKPAESETLKARQDRYVEALRLYERALGALQGRDFRTAGTTFQQVIDQFPEERELHERSRLYLLVCERESQPPPPPPQTLEERIYAATLAINAGSSEEALQYLTAAADQEPGNDHVYYMLAVAHALRADIHTAVKHLRHAIDLNSDNRLLAAQEPDFDPLRSDEWFRTAIAPPRRRARSRPSH